MFLRVLQFVCFDGAWSNISTINGWSICFEEPRIC